MVMNGVEVMCRNCRAVNIVGENQTVETYCAYCGAKLESPNQFARMNPRSTSELNRGMNPNVNQTSSRGPLPEQFSQLEIDYRRLEEELRQERIRRRRVRIGATVIGVTALTAILTAGVVAFSFTSRAMGERPAVIREVDGDFPSLVWPDDPLLDKLPHWEGEYGEIYVWGNSASVTYYQMSESEFIAYQNACRNAGFSIQANYDRSSFHAYDKDQYSVSLYYDEEQQTMDGYLNTPRIEDAVSTVWPEHGLAELLPMLEGGDVYVMYSDEDSANLIVDHMSRDDMRAYEHACIEAGFDVDYSISDNYFYAENEDGVELWLEYDNYFGQIEISVYDY